MKAINVKRQKHDLILLGMIRTHYWSHMNASQQALWGAAWGQAKVKGKITHKTLAKLETLVQSFLAPYKSQ